MFKANINQVEYEALIAGLRLAKELGVWSLIIKGDSQLMISQVQVEFQAKEITTATIFGQGKGTHQRIWRMHYGVHPKRLKCPSQSTVKTSKHKNSGK